MSQTVDTPADQDPPATPGCAPLSRAELQALSLAARVGLLDARNAIGARLIVREPPMSIEGDLAPLAERVLQPLRTVLVHLPPDAALGAAYMIANVLLQEALLGDLRTARQLMALAAAAQADAERRPEG